MQLLGVVDTVDLSGDPELDMAAVAFKDRQGLHAELAAPVVLAPPRSGEPRQQA